MVAGKCLKNLLAVSVVAILGGCSLSESVSDSLSVSGKSASKLASSPSRWSHYSSMDDRERYEYDLRDYTAEFAASTRGEMEDFFVRVGKLAEQHGITDWENDASTYLAIGRGLRKADLTKPQYEAFKGAMGRSDAVHMQQIQKGYEG